MDFAPTDISALPDATMEIDFQALSDTRLAEMETAAKAVGDSLAELSAQGTTLVGDVLKGQGEFLQWDHYPAGDVYDRTSHAQYYYHAHPADNRTPGYPDGLWAIEHGHFHTFLRAEGMPPGVVPAALPDNQAGETADALSHIVAISMGRDGLPLRLFTTNRWVTGEQWHDAETVIGLIDRFTVTSPVPSRPVNSWITHMLRLFRPQIEILLHRRDAALADWRARHPDAETPVHDDRRLEVTSMTTIDLPEQVARLTAALNDRRRA